MNTCWISYQLLRCGLHVVKGFIIKRSVKVKCERRGESERVRQAKKTCMQGCMWVFACSTLRNPALNKMQGHQCSLVHPVVRKVLVNVLQVSLSNTVHISPKHYQLWKESNSDNVISLYINIFLAKNFYPWAFLPLVCIWNCTNVLQLCHKI